MSEQPKCPECGVEHYSSHEHGTTYQCNSIGWPGKPLNYQSVRCRIRQLEQQVATLQAEKDDLEWRLEEALDLRRSCQCSESEQCMFARERDAAIAARDTYAAAVETMRAERDRLAAVVKRLRVAIQKIVTAADAVDLLDVTPDAAARLEDAVDQAAREAKP